MVVNYLKTGRLKIMLILQVLLSQMFLAHLDISWTYVEREEGPEVHAPGPQSSGGGLALPRQFLEFRPLVLGFFDKALEVGLGQVGVVHGGG